MRDVEAAALSLPVPAAAGGEPDWTSIGLVLAIVGSFLLGNAILFRPPRVLVEELFGVRHLRLPAIREYVFHRVQVGVGFSWLLAGFALQLFGRFHPRPAGEAESFPMWWVGGVVVLTVALLAVGWWWSARTFRAHLRAHFLDHPPDLEGDAALAREVGSLFDVEPRADDTVASFAERLRREVGLPPPPRGPRAVRVIEEHQVELD